MKTKWILILWILIPIVAYILHAAFIEFPALMVGYGRWRESVSPLFVFFLALLSAWRYIVMPAWFGHPALTFIILAGSWLTGFFWLYRRYLEEKADSRQKT